MAGIFGCLQFDGRFDVQKACAILQKNALLGFEHPSEFIQNGNFGIGYAVPQFSENRAGILKSSNGRYMLVLLGELFLASGNELSKENFEKEFLEGFISFGKEYFRQCDGAFVLALYDNISKQLHLVTDPFGNFALHYAHTSEGFIFSSEQRGVAEVIGSDTLSSDAISEAIALGSRTNGKTLFDGVMHEGIGSIHTISSDSTIKFESYYSPVYGQTPPRKRSAQLEDIGDAFLDSVEKRSRGTNILLGLSGGFDSRITFAALLTLGRTDKITFITHGLPDSGDMLIASKIARKYSIPHRQIAFDDKYLSNLHTHWRETVQISEGAFGIEDSIVIEYWKQISSDFRVLIDSEGAPLYRRQIFKAREGELQRAKSLPLALYQFLSTDLVRSELLRHEVKRLAEDAGKTAMEHNFDEIPESLCAGDKIDMWDLQTMWKDKYSMTGNAQMNYIGLSHPFFSLKSFASVTEVTEVDRKKNIIHKYLLNRFAPELKHLWLDNSGYHIPYYGYSYMRYIPQLFDKAMLKMPAPFRQFSLRKPIITSKIIAEKNFTALQSLLLDRDARSDSYFDLPQLEKAVKQFTSTKVDNSKLLFQAAHLRLLLDIFS